MFCADQQRCLLLPAEVSSDQSLRVEREELSEIDGSYGCGCSQSCSPCPCRYRRCTVNNTLDHRFRYATSIAIVRSFYTVCINFLLSLILFTQNAAAHCAQNCSHASLFQAVRSSITEQARRPRRACVVLLPCKQIAIKKQKASQTSSRSNVNELFLVCIT